MKKSGSNLRGVLAVVAFLLAFAGGSRVVWASQELMTAVADYWGDVENAKPVEGDAAEEPTGDEWFAALQKQSENLKNWSENCADGEWDQLQTDYDRFVNVWGGFNEKFQSFRQDNTGGTGAVDDAAAAVKAALDKHAAPPSDRAPVPGAQTDGAEELTAAITKTAGELFDKKMKEATPAPLTNEQKKINDYVLTKINEPVVPDPPKKVDALTITAFILSIASIICFGVLLFLFIRLDKKLNETIKAKQPMSSADVWPLFDNMWNERIMPYAHRMTEIEKHTGVYSHNQVGKDIIAEDIHRIDLELYTLKQRVADLSGMPVGYEPINTAQRGKRVTQEKEIIIPSTEKTFTDKLIEDFNQAAQGGDWNRFKDKYAPLPLNHSGFSNSFVIGKDLGSSFFWCVFSGDDDDTNCYAVPSLQRMRAKDGGFEEAGIKSLFANAAARFYDVSQIRLASPATFVRSGNALANGDEWAQGEIK